MSTAERASQTSTSQPSNTEPNIENWSRILFSGKWLLSGQQVAPCAISKSWHTTEGGERVKYPELYQKLVDKGVDVDRTIYFELYNPGFPEMVFVPYNVVLRDGKYRIFGTNERQNFYPLQFFLGGPEVEFDTEDEVCDYIWTEINTPLPPPVKIPKRTQAEKDAQRAEMERSVWASRDAYLKEHGLE